MNIANVIINIISLLFATIGIVMIYDARKICKKWFSYSDLNNRS